MWVIFFPYPEDQLNPYVESSCSLYPTLGVLSAASRSFRPSPLIKRLQSWQATIMDRIIDAAANSPSPRKWSMKPRTRRPKTRHFQYLIGGVVNRVPRVFSYWQSLFCAIRREDPKRAALLVQTSQIACHLRRTSQDNPRLRSSFPSVSTFRCTASFRTSSLPTAVVATMLKRGRWSSHPSVLFHYAMLRITKKAIFI